MKARVLQIPRSRRAFVLRFVLLISALLIAPCCIGAATPAQKELSVVDPAEAGWDITALNDLATYVQLQKTTGFLIIKDRKVIYEHNWALPPDATGLAAGFTGRDAHGALQEDIASAQKSFVAILAGVATGVYSISRSRCRAISERGGRRPRRSRRNKLLFRTFWK